MVRERIPGPDPIVLDLGFMTLLTSQVIRVTFYSEREKSDKFRSEALISALGSITCRKSTTRDHGFTSEGSHTQDFYALKKIHRPRPGLNPRTSDPVARMIITGPQGSIPDLNKEKTCYIRVFLVEFYIIIVSFPLGRCNGF